MLQLPAGAVENDRDVNRRETKQAGDLAVAHALDVAQGEDLGRARRQSGQGGTEGLGQITAIPSGGGQFGPNFERDPAGRRPAAQAVEGGMNRRTAEISGGIGKHRGIRRPAQQAKEDELENVLGVSAGAGNPVGGSEHGTRVPLEYFFPAGRHAHA